MDMPLEQVNRVNAVSLSMGIQREKCRRWQRALSKPWLAFQRRSKSTGAGTKLVTSEVLAEDVTEEKAVGLHLFRPCVFVSFHDSSAVKHLCTCVSQLVSGRAWCDLSRAPGSWASGLEAFEGHCQHHQVALAGERFLGACPTRGTSVELSRASCFLGSSGSIIQACSFCLSLFSVGKTGKQAGTIDHWKKIGAFWLATLREPLEVTKYHK